MGWQRVGVPAGFTVGLACLLLALEPGIGSATASRHQLDDVTLAQTTTLSTTSRSFSGTSAVGALFTMNDGKLGSHICSASVVHSTHGDLVVTAAHCVTGVSGQIVFVPGYANGKEPYGIWPVTATFTDQAWQSSQDQDNDFAFLRLADTNGTPIEDVTGAEQLGSGVAARTVVEVIGYPDDADAPIECVNWATIYSSTQLQLDCDNFTDGTSGGPFLAGVPARGGEGTIEGVIGGYEQGGDDPDVSYATTFGPASTALFHTAEAAG